MVTSKLSEKIDLRCVRVPADGDDGAMGPRFELRGSVGPMSGRSSAEHRHRSRAGVLSRAAQSIFELEVDFVVRLTQDRNG